MTMDEIVEIPKYHIGQFLQENYTPGQQKTVIAKIIKLTGKTRKTIDKIIQAKFTDGNIQAADYEILCTIAELLKVDFWDLINGHIQAEMKENLMNWLLVGTKGEKLPDK